MSAIGRWLKRRSEQRRNRADALILGCLLQGDVGYVEIWRRTGLGPASVYPALARLEADGRVWSGVGHEPEPRRRYYFLAEHDSGHEEGGQHG